MQGKPVKYNPRPSQGEMYRFLLNTPRACLFADMGYGKTVVTATVLDTLRLLGGLGKTLIVAPIRVRDGVWPVELGYWAHLKELKVSIVAGDFKERRRALVKDADIYVINYENIPWLLRIAKKWPFKTVVVDESSKLKDPSGAWFKTLAGICNKTDRWVNLTGTPATSGIHNLWSQLFLIDQGARLGSSFKAFQQRFYNRESKGDYGSNWTLKEFAEEEIYKLISDVCLSMYECEDVELPEFTEHVIESAFTKPLRKEYETLERDMFVELKKQVMDAELFDDTVEVTAMNSAVLTGKCRQFCNGAVYYEDSTKWVDVHSLKLKAMLDVSEECYGEPLLIAYHYKPDLEKLKEVFPKAVVMSGNKTSTQDIVKAWNDGTISELIMYPGSDAHGLNLQHGGRFAAWLGPTWSLDAWLQFNKRLIRPGVSKPGRIFTLTIGDTIETDMMDRLSSNGTVLESLMKAMERRS